MGFHEVQYPPGISWGTSGGPGFNTHVVVVDSGQEERTARWAQARRKFDVAESIKTDAQLAELITFFMARQGSANGFRFKDWTDYCTSANHVHHGEAGIAPAPTDQNFSVGDGTTTVFQLQKGYTNGGVTRTRKITKPVAGTVVIAKDGVTTASGWTVNTATGQVTFTTAPTAGVILSWGGEFDIPARFGDDIDNQLPISLDAYSSGSIKVPIIEILDDGEASDEFFYGGALEVQSADDYTISGITRVWVFNFTASGKKVVLPSISTLSPGGPWFYIYNDGANSFALKDEFGTTLVTLATGTCVVVSISVDSIGTKVWYIK
jgi:uncharacterized protein (TIGR02217 family)